MYEQIAHNKRKTALLITGFIALVVAAGAAAGVLIGYGIAGTIVALVIAGTFAFLS